MDWTSYTNRMNIDGTNQRERAKNALIHSINNKAKNSLSCKEVLINGVADNLIINKGTQQYYKEFATIPDHDIEIGDYVEWADSYWIVVSCSSDEEVYKTGKLQQCNYLLKWQNENGDIISRNAIIQAANKYNDGTDGNKTMEFGSDQLSVIVPLDSESIKLKKSMSKKFFIDNNTEEPTAYELTGTGNVSDTYNGHGVTNWIVKEIAYSPTSDDLTYGVCNYKAPTTPPTPDPNVDRTTVLCTISGRNELKLGYNRDYSAGFTDLSGNVFDNVEYTWNLNCDFADKITMTETETGIMLCCDDEDCIEEEFDLEIIVDDVVVGSKTIRVVGLY